MREKFATLISNVSRESLYNYYCVQDHSRLETATFFNCSIYQIKALLKYYKIKKQKFCNLSHEELFNLYIKQNLTANEIKEKTGFSTDQIYERLNKLGIKKTKEQIQESQKRIFGSPEFKARIRKTCLRKYGHEYVASVPEFMEKRKNSNLKKYGVENVMQLDSIRQKGQETNLKRYGVQHSSQNTDVLRKQQETVFKKYGVNCIFQSRWFVENSRKKYTYNQTLFDSSWELALYIYAIDHHEPIIRNPETFTFIFKDKQHYYTPDFKYKGELIEIKGEHLIKDNILIDPYQKTGRAELYLEKMKIIHENNIKILQYHDIKFALDYIKQQYGKNYLQQFRLK